MHHPLLCANLVDLRGRPLPFSPELQLTYEGQKIRLFGLLVVQYPQESAWERVFGWRFLDPIETARRIAAGTPDDVTLVVLSHLGLRTDRALASAVPRVDLLLGGHSHDTLLESDVVAGVPIVHAGPYGRYVSRTELERSGARARVTRSELVPLLGSKRPPG
jgi:2',3'-cyclic-nucleotide 2'-phosphodiesterase (5'-nucleotidase family)